MGPYSAPSDPQLGRAMTFACCAHGMTPSLTHQTFVGGGGGEGGGHEIFTNRSWFSNFSASSKGDQQFNRVFHLVSTTPPVS